MNKAHAPADLLAAAKTIGRFAGKNVSSRAPILVVVGARPSEDILLFQNLVLDTVNLGRIRNRGSDTELIGYLERDTQPDTVFYRDAAGFPTRRAQQFVIDLMCDARRRHFMPLLLVALVEPPNVLATLSPQPLLPAFVALTGNRIVDIASTTACVPIWQQLWNLFLGTVTRRSRLKVDPEAASLMEHALRGNATISHEVVMRLANDARKSAERRGLTSITHDVLWDVFPDHFREAVRPSDAVAH